MADSLNNFAVSLYEAMISTSQKEDNIIFSPVSIFMALSMTYCGARNNTAKQMKKAMNLQGNPDDEILHENLTQLWMDAFESGKSNVKIDKATGPRVQNEYPSKRLFQGILSRQYKADTFTLDFLNASETSRTGWMDAFASSNSAVTIEIANRLWIQKEYPIESHFQGILSRQYKADAFPLDFSNASEESRLVINSWVESQTKNKITNLLPPGSITSLTKLVITNAIYFNGKWQSKFDKIKSRDMKFYTTPSSTVDVFAMFQKNRFFYVEKTQFDCKILTMPYEGSNFGMTIVLPNKLDGLSDLEVHMKDLLKTILKIQGKGMTEVEVYIPRFKFSGGGNVKELLEKLGISDLFSEGVSDLTGISNDKDRYIRKYLVEDLIETNSLDNLYVSDVLHKAIIEVDEEGTKAAAATATDAVFGKSFRFEPKPVPVFRADHPFMFFLHDLSKNVMLFLGRVRCPTEFQ